MCVCARLLFLHAFGCMMHLFAVGCVGLRGLVNLFFLVSLIVMVFGRLLRSFVLCMVCVFVLFVCVVVLFGRCVRRFCCVVWLVGCFYACAM